MRFLFAFLAIAATLTRHAAADSYKPADKVVVIHKAPIVYEGRADDVAFIGWTYEIQRVDGDRLWVPSKTPGWIDQRYVIPFDQGAAFFSAQIKRDPTNKAAFRGRALVLLDDGKFDAAIADFSELIRQNPKDSTIWNDRGRALLRKGDLDQAISDFTEALRLEPKWPVYHSNRGIAWNKKGNYSKAILDWKAAIAIRPNFHWPHQWLAQLYANCPDKQFRNGLEAIYYATTACGLSVWKEPQDIENLAAAYAESGQIDVAIQWQTKANAMYPKEVDRERGAQLLKAYQRQRENPAEPPAVSSQEISSAPHSCSITVLVAEKADRLKRKVLV